MNKSLHFAVATVFAAVSCAAFAAPPDIKLKPWVYDPVNTDLVSSKIIDGLGCPLNAPVATGTQPIPNGALTDPACTTGDFKDDHNRALLLSKTGPLYNWASSGASIDGLKNQNIVLTELGFDIRNGSHCGAGAPRFDIQTTTGIWYAVGCSSSATPPTSTSPGTDWTRMRWGTGSAGSVVAYRYDTYLPELITAPIKSIDLVFDEGTDALSGPDPKGIAILDNVDINGVMAGR